MYGLGALGRALCSSDPRTCRAHLAPQAGEASAGLDPSPSLQVTLLGHREPFLPAAVLLQDQWFLDLGPEELSGSIHKERPQSPSLRDSNLMGLRWGSATDCFCSVLFYFTLSWWF